MAEKKMTKKEKQWTIKIILGVICLVALAIFWFVIKPMLTPTYEVPEGTVEFHFIDVGQGDATLIKVDEENILIDTGKASAKDELLTYLDDCGVEQIEYFIITHFDTDHYGNGVTILDTYDVEMLIMPNQPKTGTTYEKFINKAQEQKKANEIEILNANDMVGDKINLGELEMSFLAPLRDDYDDSNDFSVTMMARYGNRRVLLSGDAEKEAEADIVERYSSLDLDCDVFKLGHHGSRTSSSQALLDLATPTYVLVSCGVGNEYGHPHKEVLERVKDMELYRTDTQGTIVLSITNDKLTFKTEK
ncbi:MAG: MBL fold metallo-hydrolase [Clostridia bacterium]|nr:MBL fold metallo-hydrolase [Clostridia bacterium]